MSPEGQITLDDLGPSPLLDSGQQAGLGLRKKRTVRFADNVVDTPPAPPPPEPAPTPDKATPAPAAAPTSPEPPSAPTEQPKTTEQTPIIFPEPPPAALLSRSSSPQASFPVFRLGTEGQPSVEDISTSTPKKEAGVVIGSAPRFQTRLAAPGPEIGHETWAGHVRSNGSGTFGSAPQNVGSAFNTDRKYSQLPDPGPGTYTTDRPRAKEGGLRFATEKRSLEAPVEKDEAAPGFEYNPNEDSIRMRTPSALLSHTKRTLFNEPSPSIATSPGPGSYANADKQQSQQAGRPTGWSFGSGPSISELPTMPNVHFPYSFPRSVDGNFSFGAGAMNPPSYARDKRGKLLVSSRPTPGRFSAERSKSRPESPAHCSLLEAAKIVPEDGPAKQRGVVMQIKIHDKSLEREPPVPRSRLSVVGSCPNGIPPRPASALARFGGEDFIELEEEVEEVDRTLNIVNISTLPARRPASALLVRKPITMADSPIGAENYLADYHEVHEQFRRELSPTREEGPPSAIEHATELASPEKGAVGGPNDLDWFGLGDYHPAASPEQAPASPHEPAPEAPAANGEVSAAAVAAAGEAEAAGGEGAESAPVDTAANPAQLPEGGRGEGAENPAAGSLEPSALIARPPPPPLIDVAEAVPPTTPAPASTPIVEPQATATAAAAAPPTTPAKGPAGGDPTPAPDSKATVDADDGEEGPASAPRRPSPQVVQLKDLQVRDSEGRGNPHLQASTALGLAAEASMVREGLTRGDLSGWLSAIVQVTDDDPSAHYLKQTQKRAATTGLKDILRDQKAKREANDSAASGGKHSGGKKHRTKKRNGPGFHRRRLQNAVEAAKSN